MTGRTTTIPHGVALTATLDGGVGLLMGSTMPGGPLTTGAVLLAMTIGAVTGLGAGRLLGSRWALLVAPSAFGLAYELARLGSAGATVDSLRPSSYGLLALAGGRGVVLLAVLLPMVTGKGLDRREEVTELALPVHLVQGQHEIRGRTVPAEEWFTTLTAPHKQLETFPTAGHRPMFEQPDRFVAHLNGEVLPQLNGGLS